MLGTNRVYWALALVTTGASAAAVSCGGDEDTKPNEGTGGSTASVSSSSSSSSSASSASAGGGGGYVCPPGGATTLALTKLSFGHGNSGEWKKVGLNVDGLASTGASTDVCTPNSGGTADVAYPDGENGIDNSFGKNLLPLIIGFLPTWPDDVNNFLTVGRFNALLKMYCLPPTGDAEFTTKLFGGTDLGAAPKYDGTDMWPVAPELLSDPMDPESSTISFAKSTVTGQMFDSGKNQQVIFTIPMDYMGKHTTVKLTLYGAQMVMNFSPDRKTATGGMIGGVLNTEEFIVEAKKIGWTFDLCTQMLFDSVITQVRQASDILTDGTQDPTMTCDGISIGIGFEMKEVQLGAVGPPQGAGQSCP